MNPASDSVLFFDQKYSCLPCSQSVFSLFSTSKDAVRPTLSLTGNLNLYLSDLICVGAGEEMFLDFGIRILVHGCVLLCTYHTASGTDGLVFPSCTYSVSDHLDLTLCVSNPGTGLVILSPSKVICSLSIRSGCDCASSLHQAVTPLLGMLPVCDGDLSDLPRGDDAIDDSSLLMPDDSGDFSVVVHAITIHERCYDVPVERILRWIFSLRPKVDKLTPYAATTGLKSVGLSGVQDFYRQLHPSPNRSVHIFTDNPGLHYLFANFRSIPGSIPIKYRSIFQRARFARSLSIMPARLHNVDPTTELIKESYINLVKHFKLFYKEVPFVVLSPLPHGLEDFLALHFPEVLSTG